MKLEQLKNFICKTFFIRKKFSSVCVFVCAVAFLENLSAASSHLDLQLNFELFDLVAVAG